MKSLDELLTEIETRAESATPGPWEHRYENAGHGVFFGPLHRQNICLNIGSYGNEGHEGEFRNGEFIAHARTDIPKMAAVIRYADEVIHSEFCGSNGCHPVHLELAKIWESFDKSN